MSDNDDGNLQWWQSLCTWYAVVLLILVVAFSTKFTMSETTPSGTPEGTWYSKLSKPPGIPPNWVFGVVWGVLYILILAGVIIAAWDYHQVGSFPIMCFYTVILLMTMFWCFAFFQQHDPVLGSLILVSLLIVTGLMIWLLYPTTFTGAWFCESKSDIGWWEYLPFAFYILFFIWICCATYFNIGVAIKN